MPSLYREDSSFPMDKDTRCAWNSDTAGSFTKESRIAFFVKFAIQYSPFLPAFSIVYNIALFSNKSNEHNRGKNCAANHEIYSRKARRIAVIRSPPWDKDCSFQIIQHFLKTMPCLLFCRSFMLQRYKSSVHSRWQQCAALRCISWSFNAGQNICRGRNRKRFE